MGLSTHVSVRLRLFAVVLVLISFACGVRADGPMVCAVCGQPIIGNWYHFEDRKLHKRVDVCSICAKIESRCYMCELPVRDGFKSLPDGRFICARDLKSVVESDDEAKDICKTVKYDVDRLLSRFLTIPDNDIQLSIVDKFHLENLMHAPGNGDDTCVSVYGVTSSHPQPNHKRINTIDLLSCMQKPHLMAVCAHEYTHTWVFENVAPDRLRALDKNMHEAFCELVAYKYMESLHEQDEMDFISKYNNYTVGKIKVLLAADQKYGFDTIMEWMKNGEDTTLTMDNLDRIRDLRDHRVTPNSPQSTGLVYGHAIVPTAAPSTLLLKSISGVGQHRFAMINSTTFEVMERAKVRVGQTNVSVKCLEIGNNFVTIQVEGSPEKKQLFLRDTQ